jgi:hypothetical protein
MVKVLATIKIYLFSIGFQLGVWCGCWGEVGDDVLLKVRGGDIIKHILVKTKQPYLDDGPRRGQHHLVVWLCGEHQVVNERRERKEPKNKNIFVFNWVCCAGVGVRLETMCF